MEERRFCPKCKSDNVEWKDSRLGAGEQGNWLCNKCGFHNVVFPIKRELNKVKTKKNKNAEK